MQTADPLARFRGRLSLPLIAAPMFLVSGVELAAAACRHGVIGAFPTVNCRSSAELEAWLTEIEDRLRASSDALGKPAAPVCPNLIVHRSNARLSEDLQVLLRHQPEIVITSVGSPQPVLTPLHDAGALVFADVASIRHAGRAIEAGADGLVLLTAGAGGQTGWLNPFAFVRAVRAFFDGPIVLAGAARCAPPKCSAAISPTWAPSSSPRARAWPIPDTRRCWSKAPPTTSCSRRPSPACRPTC